MKAKDAMVFRTEDGIVVPAVTAEQMREGDRIAVEEIGLGILQMMDNAGRSLALNVMEMLDSAEGEVTVLVGSGGSGGGGLCCARHLHNHGFKVSVLLDREASMLSEAAGSQLQVLRAPDVQLTDRSQAGEVLRRSQMVVDALIGYGLRGVPRGRTAELISLCNQHGLRVLSLDVPSELDATMGETPGSVVRPNRILTLALPKTGLHGAPGEVYLADIGIPPEVFQRFGLSFDPPFTESYWVRLVPVREGGSVALARPDDLDLQGRGQVTDQAALDQRYTGTIRFLTVDAVQKAQHGHPGTSMGAAGDK